MSTFTWLVLIWIAVALITFPFLLRMRVPYGRHTTMGWGPMIDNRWGWFWMELPALLIFPLMVVFGPREKDSLTWLLLLLWTAHYVNRTLIFPFRLKTTGKKMPLLIAVSAVCFNGVNGAINGWWLGFAAPADLPFPNALAISGTALFITGILMNLGPDTRLIALREQGDGYKIPRGSLFDRISCPNHFGEIVEWTGFALAAWSLPAFSFALWTFINLSPRAQNHHAWYRERFPDYPPKRKGVIPYLW